MKGQLSGEQSAKMKKIARDIRWTYNHSGSKKTVTGTKRSTGEVIVQRSDAYSYTVAQLQSLVDLTNQEVQRTNNTTVLPYDMTFKDEASRPTFNRANNPPRNPLMVEAAEFVLNDEQKGVVKKWGWAFESNNPTGVRDMLMEGSDMPGFLRKGPSKFIIEESDAPFDDDLFDEMFTRDDQLVAMGAMASLSKHCIDCETNQVKLFEIPKTISDPAFELNLSLIDPPSGKTHDCNMDPKRGSNKCSERRDIMNWTAAYLAGKCKRSHQAYLAYVRAHGPPNMTQALELIEATMKDPVYATAIWAAMWLHRKMEPMKRENIENHRAERGIWGPGQVEPILGKLLMKNITLSSFRRFSKGMSHGVSSGNDGFGHMFFEMASTYTNAASFDEFKEINAINNFSFKELLNHTAWRDDDIKRWDCMQFQVYMAINFQYYVMSYKWLPTLDADAFNWLYLFLVLATMDTTVVSDFGYGPEIFTRILPSGIFLTASGGSKTHDTMNMSFQLKQCYMAEKLMNRLRTMKAIIDPGHLRLLERSYKSFDLGNPFVSFSDDCLLMCWRVGIIFGQVIDRAKFFGDMFNISFKVADREWDITRGKLELDVMLDVISKFKPFFKDFPDLTRETDSEYAIAGIDSVITLKAFKKRCLDWYPLVSQLNENKIVNKGINFLKFYFTAHEDVARNRIIIIPIREDTDLYHKLYYCRVHYENVGQMLVKLRSYAYYTHMWEEAYETFRRVHDYLKDRYLSQVLAVKDDIFLKVELPRKLGLSMVEIQADFPSRSEVNAFYFPRSNPDYLGITNLRNKILASSYRALDYVVWDLIRAEGVTKNIGGVYPRKFGDEFQERLIKSRGKQGLSSSSKKPPGVIPKRAALDRSKLVR